MNSLRASEVQNGVARSFLGFPREKEQGSWGMQRKPKSGREERQLALAVEAARTYRRIRAIPLWSSAS